jgi:bleomycin hydrolase
VFHNKGKTMSTNNLNSSLLKQFQKNFESCDKNILAQNAAGHVAISNIATNRNEFSSTQHCFSNSIKLEGKATNQHQSGRCWLFAALNTIRLPLMKKYHLEDFEFSQAYLFFWDKLEKSNFFLENILATRSLPQDSREVHFLLACPQSDGGQWHMFVNLVEKYGLIPKSNMPDTFPAKKSAGLNQFLSGKLREYACFLREKNQKKASLASLKKEKMLMMQEVWNILCIFLGTPPTTFDWQFKDKKDKVHSFSNLTPKSFVKKHLPYKFSDQVCLINAPTKDKPFQKTYTVKFLGNVVEGEPIIYLNLPISELKRTAIASIKQNNAVWFGCDVGKEFHRELGSLDMDIYDNELVFGTKFNLSKAQRLDYRQSLMTHAMVLSAVDLKNNKPKKWRIENSWGEKIGDKGYLVMTDAWFDEYLYETVVDKKFLTPKQRTLLKQKPKELAPWDPMGSLA